MAKKLHSVVDFGVHMIKLVISLGFMGAASELGWTPTIIKKRNKRLNWPYEQTCTVSCAPFGFLGPFVYTVYTSFSNELTFIKKSKKKKNLPCKLLWFVS